MFFSTNNDFFEVSFIFSTKRDGSQRKFLNIYILIRYWMAMRFCLTVCDSVCSSAIETSFPLFNFKTKQIFGIFMTLRKFFSVLPPPNGRPGRRSPGGQEKSRRRQVFREFSLTIQKKNIFIFSTRRAGSYTQRNLFEILLNQPEIRLYLPFSV